VELEQPPPLAVPTATQMEYREGHDRRAQKLFYETALPGALDC